MSYRLSCVALLLGLVATGCSDSSTSPTPASSPRFSAALLPANEVPPISNADQTGSGAVSVTLNTTKDATGNITSATADFIVTLTGFPTNTTLTGAHIHPGTAGNNGGVVVSTGLTNGEVVLSANGTGGFSKGPVAVDAALAQAIINTPGNYYFNVHTTLNGGGAARGQLVRAN